MAYQQAYQQAYQPPQHGFTFDNQPWLSAPSPPASGFENFEPKFADATVKSPDTIYIRTAELQDRDSYRPHNAHSQHPHTERLAKAFTARLQLHTILWENSLHWLCNVALLLLVFGALKYYENKGNTHSSDKHIFNAIITGLQVMLALSFFSSLKELAKMLRWRVLARKGHSMREVDLILNAESLAKLARLWWHHFRDICGEIWRRTGLQAGFRGSKLYDWVSPTLKYIPSTPRSPSSFKRLQEQHVHEKSIIRAAWSIAKINIWLLINIAAQVGIAMIGLTYGVDAGYPIVPAPYSDTGAWQADLLHFYPLSFGGVPPASGSSEEAAAHTLGDIGTIMALAIITDPNDPLTYQLQGSDAYYLVNDEVTDTTYYMYRYYSYDSSNYFNTTWSVPTNRTVYASWANCLQFSVVKGGDGKNTTITYETTDGETMTMAVDLVGPGVTTYIYPSDRWSVCSSGDPRCALIYALQERSNEDQPFLFQCEITVSQVHNASADFPEQQLADAQARNASAAASLSGFGSSFATYTSNDAPAPFQFQRYTNDSYWSLAGDSGYEAGQRMAEFAISSLAGMANFNPRLDAAPGPVPTIGILLTVEWKWVRLLLPGIAIAHGVLFVLVVLATSPYVVRDDSNLANALLLRPVVEKVGPAGAGSCLSGKEIAEILDDDVLEGRRVAYAAVKTRDSMSSGAGGGPGVGGDVYRLSIAPIDPGGRPGSISSLSVRTGWHRDGTYE